MIDSTRVINEPCISHIRANSAAYSETVNQIAAEAKPECTFIWTCKPIVYFLPDEKEKNLWNTERWKERTFSG